MKETWTYCVFNDLQFYAECSDCELDFTNICCFVLVLIQINTINTYKNTFGICFEFLFNFYLLPYLQSKYQVTSTAFF